MSEEARERRRPSLRRALLVGLLLPLVVLVPLAAALLYGLALQPALDALDRALTDTAVALAQIVEVKDGRAELPLGEQTARALRADLVDETVFAVADPAGRLLGGSAELLRSTPKVASGQWQFFAASLDGKPVRVAAYGRPCGASSELCSIVVAETMGKREAAQRAALLAALVGGVALALPLALLAMLAVGRALRPVRRAADEVRSLTPERLAQVETAGVPGEIRGFVDALNGLIGRLRSAGEAQRAFVADAAHQLRTPLAVMRVEAAEALDRLARMRAEAASSLERSHVDDALRPTLERLHAAAERGAHLAHQLLAVARTEGIALDPARQPQPLDLAAVAAAAAERWLQPSIDAGQDLGFDLRPAPVDGFATLLEELLGNLVHNAVEHAGRGARITVRTRSDEASATAVVEVEDDGPGVAVDKREALWQRFRRGDDARGSGSGLGLSIVADIARLHGGEAALDAGAGGRGLLVRVRLPLGRGATSRPAGAPSPAPADRYATSGATPPPARR